MMQITLHPSEVKIAESACELCKENWVESHEDPDESIIVPVPEVFPEVKGALLLIPLNKEVIEDLLVRVQDEHDIARDHFDSSQCAIVPYGPGYRARKHALDDEIDESEFAAKSAKCLKKKIEKMFKNT